jgi:hypothetical protein
VTVGCATPKAVDEVVLSQMGDDILLLRGP